MFKKSLNIAEKIFTVCDHVVEQESQEGGPALLSASTLVLLTEGAVSQEGHQSLSCPQERLHSEPAEPLQPLKATVGSHPWKGKKLGDCFGSSVTLCSHLGQAAELGEHPSAPCSSPEQPGWVLWPADLSKHIPSAAWSSPCSSLTLRDDSLLPSRSWVVTPQQVTSPGWGPCAREKPHPRAVLASPVGDALRGAAHGSGKALGVRSEAARPGEEATQVTDVTWTGKPTLLAPGEGSQLGRKFLEVRRG